MNSDMFLQSFAKIESFLRSRTGSDPSVPFMQVVQAASSSLPAVRRHKDSLREYADLRNAIVHERGGGYVIAEPNERAVKEIMCIQATILDPPKLLPMFQGNVDVVQASDSVASAITLMHQRSYSQVPVIEEGRFIGLLTSNTIVRWLGAQTELGIADLEHRNREVLKHTEVPNGYVFLSPGKTLFDALDAFKRHESKGLKLDAILITHSGAQTEILLGILTVFDIPKLLSAL